MNKKNISDLMYDINKIQIGHKFYFSRGDLYHIVSEFEDDNKKYYVIKTWAKYRGYWSYEVISRICLVDWFEIHQK